MRARQFEVFRTPNPRSARAVPWLLVLQADLLEEFPTRLVAPMVRPEALKPPASRLNPVFEVAGEKAVMLTQQIGAVATRSLKEPVATLAERRSEIIGAVEFLLTGV